MPSNPAGTFHASTTKYSARVGRIVTDVHLTLFYDPDAQPETPFPLHKTTALWDTGAMTSVVTQSTAQAIGLVPVGAAMVNHAGGCSQSNTYLVNFFLPNRVLVHGVQVIECPDNAGVFGAIIGMDIISRGDFSITNCDGQTWMTFRIPSLRRIDYVV